MASAAARTAVVASQAWSCAVAGISRSVGGSSSSRVLHYRKYSDDAAPPSPEPSPAAVDLPADSPLPEAVPDSIEAAGADKRKITYPPRNFRTPHGVYKAILLGEVGQRPFQKTLKSGKSVTIFSVGTGGIYNNRRLYEGERPEEYAEKSSTQWHRVAIYYDRVASMAMQHVKVGSQVYLEGNIESRVFNDPKTGVVKRIREIAVRANGRLMFMETPNAKPALNSEVQSPVSGLPFSALATDVLADSVRSGQNLP